MNITNLSNIAGFCSKFIPNLGSSEKLTGLLDKIVKAATAFTLFSFLSSKFNYFRIHREDIGNVTSSENLTEEQPFSPIFLNFEKLRDGAINFLLEDREEREQYELQD